MNEPIKNEEQDVLSLVKKIQQQLGFLEKKLDLLLQQQQQQPSPRPFEQERFRKPFRPSYEQRPDFRGGQPRTPFQQGQGGAHKKFNKGRKNFFRSKRDGN